MAVYTQEQVQVLKGYIDGAQAALAAGDNQNALNYVQLYYASQTDFRGYAIDALQVVSNTGLFGTTANQELANALGADQWSDLRPKIAVDLAKADMGLIIANPSKIPDANQIADYHSQARRAD